MKKVDGGVIMDGISVAKRERMESALWRLERGILLGAEVRYLLLSATATPCAELAEDGSSDFVCRAT